MAQVNQIQSFQGRFVMQLATAPDPAKLLLTDTYVYLSGQSETVSNEPKTWTHVILASARSAFDQLDELLNTQKFPKVWLRYGIADGQSALFTDWEPQILVSVKGKASATPSVQHGYEVVMVTADLLYKMAKTERLATRKGKISDVVNAIARDGGFEKFAIETTQNDYALIQSFESDLEFIKSRILPLATNSAGESQFMLYARGSFLHFHTINYQLNGVFSFDIGELSSTLDTVTMENRVNENMHTDAAGISLIAFDPLTGKTAAWNTSPDSELSFGDTHPEVDGRVYFKAHVGQNQLTALYAESQNRYTKSQVKLHEVSFLIKNYPYMGVGDLVKTRFVQGRGDPWSGFYVVSYVRHVVDNSDVNTLYVLVRGEFTGDFDGVGKQVSEFELTSSPLTNTSSGDFSSLSGGTTVPVNSPDALLTPTPAG